MKQVAIISQPLRAIHCHAFLGQGSDEQVVLTTDPSAFVDLPFNSATRVVQVSPPPELLPTARLARAKLSRRMVGRARAGSGFGRWFERTLKKVMWRLRYLDRLALLRRARKPAELDLKSIEGSAMFLKLAEEHQSGDIDRIVVFDVFDLPVALTFAEPNGIEVLVR
jgi:hypothetical protein